jgi:hypothetical protein
MLDGLNKVDWGSLTDAYGPAEKVPRLLLRLTSANADDREGAMYTLYGHS